MIIVKKNNPGVIDKTVNPTQTYWLNRAAKEGNLNECMAHESTKSLMKMLHNNDLWLICECQPSASLLESPAIGVVNRKGKLFFRNLPSRLDHSENCYFRYTKLADSDKNKKIIHLIPNPLNLHHSEKEKTSSAYQRGPTRISGLARLLLYLLERSGGLNHKNNHNFKDTLNGIREAAKELDAWKGVSLDTILDLTTRYITSQAVKISKMREGGHRSAYGVVVGIVHKVEKEGAKWVLVRNPSKYQTGGQRIKLVGKLDRLGQTSGPYIAIVTQAPSLGQKFVQPQNAAIIPVASTLKPIPIQSELERKLMLSMMDYADFLSSKKIAELAVQKSVDCFYITDDQKKSFTVDDQKKSFTVRGSKGDITIRTVLSSSLSNYQAQIEIGAGNDYEIIPLTFDSSGKCDQLNVIREKVRSHTY